MDLDDSGIEDLRQEIMAAHRSGRGPLPRRDRRGVGGTTPLLRRHITPIQSRSVTLNDILGEFVNLREVMNFLSILEIKDEI